MAKISEPKEGEWVFPRRRGYKLVCCDCGLTHILNFRIRNGHIEFQAFKNQRATGQRRRWQKRRLLARTKKVKIYGR